MRKKRAPQSAPLENLANSGCPHSSSDDWQQGQSQSHLSQPSQQGQSQSSQQQVVSATFTSSFIVRHLHPFKPRSNPFSYASSGESPIHWLGRSLALSDFRRLKLALMLPVIDCGLKLVARNFIFCVVNSCNSCHWLKPMVGDGFSERRIRSAFGRENPKAVRSAEFRVRCSMPKFFGSAKSAALQKTAVSSLATRHSLLAAILLFASRQSLPFFPTCRFADLTICRKPGSARASPSRFPLPRLKFAIWLVL